MDKATVRSRDLKKHRTACKGSRGQGVPQGPRGELDPQVQAVWKGRKELLEIVAQWVLLEHLVLWDPEVVMERRVHPVLLATLVNQVHLEIKEKLACLAHSDLKESKGNPDLLGHQAILELLENMEIREQLASLVQSVFQEIPVHKVLLVHLENLGLRDNRVRLEIMEKKDLKEQGAHLELEGTLE